MTCSVQRRGCAVPYAIGAKFGYPDRPVIAFAGDGAMQMNGLAELITIQRYWQEWSDPRLIVAVLHNNDLNHVTWELRAMGGAPAFRESQSFLMWTTPASPQASACKASPSATPTTSALPGRKPSLRTGPPFWMCIPIQMSRRSPRTPHLSKLSTPSRPSKGDESTWGIIKESVKTKAQELLMDKEP
ncbi:thiamine pyrophosphate-dependent enzyme [Arthrobacter globiformis]|uniref:thiamine pyrophosphate-dependent enzyme n=1 Tax=Arthrobacter globiformis TaxID=1665 RepID=UPI002783C6A2|nr:hypothetical protein [Arthrobacter globiformis]